MRIHLLSDLHFESAKMPKSYSPPECDLVILSGDIVPGVEGVMWAMNTFTCPVLYTPGNHEFWHKRTIRKHVQKMKDKAAGSNVQVLYNDAVEIDGVRFLGTTMWTDYNLYGTEHLSIVVGQQEMNDYATDHRNRGINILKGDVAAFTAVDSVVEHMVAKNFLMDEFTKPFDGKTVVMTHHAPSELSIVEMFKHDELSPAYASRLENIMLAYDPVLWTHGHTHFSFDYMIGDTRVVCNPRGYGPDQLNADFDPGFVVEI